jgi:hypothetical protein
MRIALATCAALPAEFTDDEMLAEALARRGAEAEFAVWDDAVEWEAFDLIVIRSTWDYTQKLDAFRAWADELGERLRNQPAVVRWNGDKRYLGDLADAGIPVVETRYVADGDELPPLSGEIVVKPSISAGGRNTGRFGTDHHDEAHGLIERIVAEGRTAMVQPYLGAVDTRGETAIVCVDGRESHVLRKGAVLRPDEVAPVRAGDVGAAEAMYDPELVGAGQASAAERELAAQVIVAMVERFGAAPLYARVDMISADGDGTDPVLLELEAIEPCLYFETAPQAAEQLAEAILAARPAPVSR